MKDPILTGYHLQDRHLHYPQRQERLRSGVTSGKRQSRQLQTPVPLHTLRKSSRNFARTLENSKRLTSVRKALKWGRATEKWQNSCVAFSLALAPPLHQLNGYLEDSSPLSQFRTQVPGSRASKADLIHKWLRLSILTGQKRCERLKWGICLFCPSLNPLKVEKWQALLENILSWPKNPQFPGTKSCGSDI